MNRVFPNQCFSADFHILCRLEENGEYLNVKERKLYDNY